MFNHIYKDKKVVVTGDTGFKGSWLCAWLLELGAEVYGLALDIPTQPSMYETTGLGARVNHVMEDIRHQSAVAEFIGRVQPDFVFHLAAQPIVKTAYEDPADTMSSNIMGTVYVLDALRRSNHPCTAVMITSDKCYDNVEWVWGYREHDALGGKDPYSASKGAAELMIKTYYHAYFKQPTSNIRVCAVRAGNVIGGGDWAASRIVPDCVRAWSANQPVEIRSPRATRPWQHVLEPLSGYLRAGQVLSENKEINGEAYNFGPAAEQNQTVLELLKAIGSYWHFELGIEPYQIYENSNFHEAGLLKLNCDKALFQLGWRPTLNFEQTTELTAAWYDTYYNSVSPDMAAVTLQQIKRYIAVAQQLNQIWTK